MKREFICRRDFPIAETSYGRVRGYVYDDIYTFLGMKYADAPRYQMPRPPKPWSGVQDAQGYGYSAPQMTSKERLLQAGAGLFDAPRLWVESEDCQNINVWTPSLDENAKKPVMVWIHGGGYTHGAANASDSCVGDRLSRFGDVVVVSFNHRLNILGCLDLSEWGEQYANTGSLVMADIVAALEWVRDEISHFGGDPGNVTVFGHSSGGAKIANLLQMPSAEGLFQRAIIQTGIIPPALRSRQEDGYAVARAILRELGIGKENISEIERVPLDRLIGAYNTVAPVLRSQGVKVEWGVHTNECFPGEALEAGLGKGAKQVSIMTGTAIGEFWALSTYPGKEAFDEALLKEQLAAKFGERADELVRMFREAYPNKDLSLLLALDSHGRKYALKYLDLCAGSGCQELYSYLFAFEFPYMGGMPAWHGAEIPFIFRTTDGLPVCNRPEVTQRLEEQVSSAWVQFAKSGSPANEYLPQWRPYRLEDKATMILDDECCLRVDYDEALVNLLDEVAPWFR